jgi:hypothetical protein
MADEAFALSPISARATQPREEDYDAIREAFMETSRGRWFLGEYARRNRNTDTRIVLDAVARIEENLAAQKQPIPDDGLSEALVAIRSAVDEARAAGLAALDGLALEPSLAPLRKAARVIREISWRLREIGADGRICDLIDSQVSAIEAGCGQISSANARSGLSAAFDLLETRIEALHDSDPAKAPGVEEAISSPWAAPADEAPAAAVETAPPPLAASEPETTNHSALPDEAAVAAPEVADMPAEAADADDEAVLDMIAFEMAAADPSDFDDSKVADADDGDVRLAAPAPFEPPPIAQAPEPAAVPAAAPVVQPSVEPSLVQPSFDRPIESPREPSLEPSLKSSLAPSLEPSLEPSLGATLIANGIVRRRQALTPDPLAAIRRLSQAEKIALFS